MDKEQNKKNVSLIWKIGVSGIIAMGGLVYILITAYSQVEFNKQDIKTNKIEFEARINNEIKGLHAHINVIDQRLTKKISEINILKDESHQHQVNFLEYQLKQRDKDIEDLKRYYELKIEIEILKAKQ